MHRYSSYNLGSNGQTPVQSEIFLKHVVKTSRPKIVVLETYPFFFESDNVESELNLIANGLDDITLSNIKRVVISKNLKLIIHLFIMLYEATKIML